MADGRLFTDYRPRCDINYWASPPTLGKTGRTAPAGGSYANRQFMIANADALLAAERARAYAGALCAPCMAPFDRPGTMLPEKDLEVCDAQTCRRVATSQPDGLGTGRAYAGIVVNNDNDKDGK